MKPVIHLQVRGTISIILINSLAVSLSLSLVADTWLLVYFNQIPSETTGRRRRSFDIYSPEPSTLEAEVYT